MYFVFERDFSLGSLPFYIAVDDIMVIDLECGMLKTKQSIRFF
jgi:hypothetical protein